MENVTGKEVLAAVAAAEQRAEQRMDDATIQPAMIAHRNVAIEDVEKFWAGHYNDIWAEKINEKLDNGFIVLCIQTEWSKGYGHQTMIYLVKMKK